MWDVGDMREIKGGERSTFNAQNKTKNEEQPGINFETGASVAPTSVFLISNTAFFPFLAAFLDKFSALSKEPESSQTGYFL